MVHRRRGLVPASTATMPGLSQGSSNVFIFNQRRLKARKFAFVGITSYRLSQNTVRVYLSIGCAFGYAISDIFWKERFWGAFGIFTELSNWLRSNHLPKYAEIKLWSVVTTPNLFTIANFEAKLRVATFGCNAWQMLGCLDTVPKHSKAIRSGPQGQRAQASLRVWVKHCETWNMPSPQPLWWYVGPISRRLWRWLC